MYLEQKDLTGNPFIGIFSATNKDITLIPANAENEFRKTVENVLGTKAVSATIYNSNLIGIFCCMNSSGIVLGENAYKDEIEELSQHFENIGVMKGATAIGNLITCNDHGAITSPLLPQNSIKILEKTLSIKATKMKIAGLDTSGSCLAATNKGFLANPNTSPEELNKIEKALGVSGESGSVNYGNPFVKAGLIANDKGAIVGSTSTSFELGRIDEALFFDR